MRNATCYPSISGLDEIPIRSVPISSCEIKGPRLTEWTDVQLLNAIRDGVPMAHRILYQRYATYAIKLASRYMHDKAQAEEIAQDVWLALHLHISKRNGITEFKTYLGAAVVNRCRKILARRSGKTVSLDADLLLYLEKSEWITISMLEGLSGKVEQENLVRTMNKCLSPQEFHAVKLRYFHDCSYGEIAEFIGETESRIRQITHRALKTLRKEL
jgi:RNA polymerase sigma factor (sigma-70 family)